jgi:hypothetical protein
MAFSGQGGQNVWFHWSVRTAKQMLDRENINYSAMNNSEIIKTAKTLRDNAQIEFCKKNNIKF